MTTIKGSENGAALRNRLSKSIVKLAILLMQKQEWIEGSRDLAAFYSVSNKSSLLKLPPVPRGAGIGWKQIVSARIGLGAKPEAKLWRRHQSDDWAGVAQELALIGQALRGVEVSEK